MRRAHGKEMGVIECWYTKADKLPVETNAKVKVVGLQKGKKEKKENTLLHAV